MYSNVVNLIIILNIISNFLWVFGIAFFFWGIIGLCWGGWGLFSENNPKKYRKVLISGVVCFILFMSCIGFGSSYFMNYKWQVARAAAPKIDEYVEKHPEAIYNPDVMLGKTSDAALGILDSLQSFPKIIEQVVAGKSIVEIKEEKDFEEFNAWKKAREVNK